TPPAFRGVDPLLAMSAFTPINQTWPTFGRSIDDRGNSAFMVFGTLRPGLSIDAAREAVRAKAKSLEKAFPDVNRNVSVVIAKQTHTRPNITVAQNVPAIAAAFMVLV